MMLKSLVVIALLIAPVASAVAAPVVDPLQRPALNAAIAQHGLMLDIEHAGGRLVAVGERGLVLLSDDDGANWRQARVPVSVTLTAVDFVSATQGWAVGHSGVVLHTVDGGENWFRQLNGVQAADLAMTEAENASTAQAGNEQAARYLDAANWLVKDGADKPFLDVHFIDDKKGFIVGAYGLLLATDDGGASWSSRITTSDNVQGMNLYSINSLDGVLYIAGEQGYFSHSTDGGLNFERIRTPYQGTWFVTTGTADGKVFLGGLRGNAHLYDPVNRDFTLVNITTGVSFNDALTLSHSRMLFVDQAGRILESLDYGESVHFFMRPPGAPLTVLAAAKQEGVLVGGGFGGVVRLSLNSASEVKGHD